MAPDVYFLSLHLLQLCLPGMLLLPCQQQHSLSEGLLLGCRSCCACVNVTDSMTFGKQKLSPQDRFPPTALTWAAQDWSALSLAPAATQQQEMSLAKSSQRAALLGVLLLVSPIAQNLVRGQLTPAPVQTCHSFHCFGEMCYQEAKFSNQMAECEPGQHYCELIQLNTSHYLARCSHSCERGYETGLRPCQLASTAAPSPGPCSLQCCGGGPHCLALSLDHLIIPEDKLVPTPPVPKRNEKVCATFSCQGSDCFKGQKAVAICSKGLGFCELKRSSSGYTAGCSQTCVARIYRCHGAMAQACSQECCQALASGSCLRLDGNLHFSRAAPGATRSPLLWSLARAILLLLLHSTLLPFPFP